VGGLFLRYRAILLGSMVTDSWVVFSVAT